MWQLTLVPSQVIVIRSEGVRGMPSLAHNTSGTGLPKNGVENVRGESSSTTASRRPFGNDGGSSGASLDLSVNTCVSF